MVELRPITKENIDEVLSLDILDDQRAYVSSVAHSLAQAFVYHETAFPFAVYADDAAIGFVMMGYYEPREQYTLWKFLIDKRYQGNGYGREALKLGIEFVTEKFGAKEIYTGVSIGNVRAKNLYLSFGFKETGLIEDNMEELRYIV